MYGDVQFTGVHARKLAALIAAGPELNRVAAKEVADVIREGNRIDRLRGVDATGARLRPVRARVGRYEGASGPPMVPFGEASAAIAGFYAVPVATRDGFTITAGFRGPKAIILKYHAEGRSGYGRPIVRGGKLVGFRGVKGRVTGIRRDVFGLSPRTRTDVDYAMRRHSGRLRGVLRGAGRVANRAAAFLGGL